MFPLSTRAAGIAQAMPDTCLTPTPGGNVPIPYTNSANLSFSDPATCRRKVLVESQPALGLSSQVPISDGDEAGSGGGVVSGTIKGPCRFTTGSAKILLEGQPAVYPSCTTGQNGTNANAVGQIVTPSQSKVLVTA